MKIKLSTALLFIVMMFVLASPARAQDPTPAADLQAAPTGVVTGVIVNRSLDKNVELSMDVMLHIIDQDYTEKGMLHGKSQPDGSYKFEEVSLVNGLLYAVMGVYQGATYYSDPIPANGENTLNIDLPVYEITNDLSQAQVKQMHVLFNFAQDGLEVKELYMLSNLGDRTITGTLTLDDNRPATIKFPLPQGADFIFFEPNTPDRFVKLSDGFADTEPLGPGEFSGKLMVSYLLPNPEQLGYTYTAPLNIKTVTFLVPMSAGVTLTGEGLGEPQTTNMQEGSQYLIYSLEDLPSGQTINLAFSGEPKVDTSMTTSPSAETSSPYKGLAVGGAGLGLVLIVLGVWWWRRSQQEDTGSEVIEDGPSKLSLETIIQQIALLDESYEKGKISDEDHRQQRKDLQAEARAMLDDSEIT